LLERPNTHMKEGQFAKIPENADMGAKADLEDQ
jgi:hypothetical protein